MESLKYLVFFLGSIYFGSVSAEAVCTGTVKGLRLWGNSNSWVAVSLNEFPGTTWIICDTDNPVGGVAPKSCNAMYSTALAAFTTNKKLTFYFMNFSSCDAIPSYDVNLPGSFNMLYLTN